MAKDEGEMYDEINTLVGSLAHAFDLEGPQVAKAVEAGAMSLQLGVDKEGDRYVRAEFQGKMVMVYPGAAKQEMVAQAGKVSQRGEPEAI